MQIVIGHAYNSGFPVSSGSQTQPTLGSKFNLMQAVSTCAFEDVLNTITKIIEVKIIDNFFI